MNFEEVEIDVEACQRDNAEAYKLCLHHNEEVFIQCSFDCSAYDLECHHRCTDGYLVNIEKCPCGTECAHGCPCDSWTCPNLEAHYLKVQLLN